jgi:hypothetical protein
MWHQMWCVRYTATAKCWPFPYCDSLNSINWGVIICTTFFYIQELCILPPVCCCVFQAVFVVNFPDKIL